MKTLVLGLGNELLGDDGIGIWAARSLREMVGKQADVVECSLSGLSLLDQLIGYERAIIIDAIKTDQAPPGTIYELSPEDLDPVIAPSPHYSGLPEMFALAREMELDFPKEFQIFAIEVEDPYTIGGKLSTSSQNAIDEVARKICKALSETLITL